MKQFARMNESPTLHKRKREIHPFRIKRFTRINQTFKLYIKERKR